MTLACIVDFNLASQITAFMKRTPTPMIHTSYTITVQTHTQLRTEFHRLVQFAPDDRSHMRLTDAHNAAIAVILYKISVVRWSLKQF
jgi:hypothetical protein